MKIYIEAGGSDAGTAFAVEGLSGSQVVFLRALGRMFDKAGPLPSEYAGVTFTVYTEADVARMVRLGDTSSGIVECEYDDNGELVYRERPDLPVFKIGEVFA